MANARPSRLRFHDLSLTDAWPSCLHRLNMAKAWPSRLHSLHLDWTARLADTWPSRFRVDVRVQVHVLPTAHAKSHQDLFKVMNPLQV